MSILQKPDHPIKNIGTRHGEKKFEVLLSRRNVFSGKSARYFKVAPDLRDLNYAKFVDSGNEKMPDAEEYNSHNTRRLCLSELVTLLTRAVYLRRALWDGSWSLMKVAITGPRDSWKELIDSIERNRRIFCDEDR